MEDRETKRKLLSTFYGELSSLRAAVSAIPLVGTYLDLTLSMSGQKFVEERLDYLILQLHKELDEVKEAVMDNTFLQTEEGYDLVIKTLASGAKTRQRQKLELLAKVLRGAYTGKATIHDPELYIKIIDELSERELEVAFLLYSVKTEWKTNPPKGDNSGVMSRDPVWFSANYPMYTQDELEFILPRLEKTGLIKERTGSYMGYLGSSYEPTPLLGYFVNYILKNL